MFSSSLVTEDTFAWAHHVVIFVAANSLILTPTSCSQPQINKVIKTQQRNHLSAEIVTKSRQKRQTYLNKTIQDDHKYYTSLFYQDGGHLWTDLRQRAGSVRDDHLSSNNRAIGVVKLPFKFPFYGHYVTNATLTTGGFINLGISKSRQVAKFQYVAPLMAHFNPSLNITSTVHHFTDGNEFIIQWSNVILDNDPEARTFTFQCVLNKTGEIKFIYHKIPFPVHNISVEGHPVAIGISDAYYVDTLKHYYGIWQLFRTFYTYDAVHINQSWVINNAAVIFRPKASCITAGTCEECAKRRESTEFNCTWCQKINRCSDGFDRHRPEWLSSGCISSGKYQVERCFSQESQIVSEGKQDLEPWMIAVICAGAVLLFACIAWLVYAFTHPNSRSGLCLIQHGRKNSENYDDIGPTNSSVFNKVLT
ncbi:plexin domain-containing protein 1-like isoform X4 [Montipora capricornis]|uniref:plexin domain-containing protein 1-like isoform X4 n=1 Tax=Montipora capricornis TaxID=246305 RepID=UPI0035F120D8